MANLGFDHLIISEPETTDWEVARRLAVAAAPVLEKAPLTESLEEAIRISGARFLIGTTARDRKYWDTREITEAAPVIMKRAATEKAALLFGPEDHGLSNEALTLCHTIVTLPTAGEVVSFNLSHAVALTLYTLLVTTAPEPDPDIHKSASFEEVEGMYAHIQELLTETGFLWEDNPDHMMRAVREFVNRRRPDSAEVKMIRGICRRLLYHLKDRDR
jgi:tRNA/rRNA methyltransferase